MKKWPNGQVAKLRLKFKKVIHLQYFQFWNG